MCACTCSTQKNILYVSHIVHTDRNRNCKQKNHSTYRHLLCANKTIVQCVRANRKRMRARLFAWCGAVLCPNDLTHTTHIGKQKQGVRDTPKALGSIYVSLFLQFKVCMCSTLNNNMLLLSVHKTDQRLVPSSTPNRTQPGQLHRLGAGGAMAFATAAAQQCAIIILIIIARLFVYVVRTNMGIEYELVHTRRSRRHTQHSYFCSMMSLPAVT